MVESGRRPIRRRGAQATADVIADAARQVFFEKGFDAAGIREIAQRAGANIALINRYFGSKEGLFDAAVLPELVLDPGVWNRVDDIADGVAAMLADKPPDVAFDPVVAVLRSVNSPVVGPKLRDHIETRIIAPLAARINARSDSRIGAQSARERAALLVAFIAGYDVTARMLDIDLVGVSGRDAHYHRLRRTIRAMLDGG